MDLRQGEISAEFYQVTTRTLSNWRRYGAPHSVRLLVSLAEGTHPEWLGIRLRPDGLILPDGTLQNPSELLMGPYWVAEALRSVKMADNLQERLRNAQAVTVAKNDPTSFDSIAQKCRP